MARPIRIEYAGALYHVTSRGDRREDIYLDDDDRLIWLAVFSQVCSRFNWQCHAWCLMDNHYHIVVETVEGNLSQGMRQLNGVFTQKSNRRHDRVGHVFQGRYKAILVQKESYLLELARYVVLNPVRAGMVTDVQDWQWSSYLAMVNKRASPDWLETDWILNHFGDIRQLAIAAYENFVREGIGLAPIWDGLKKQVYLGDEQFIEKAIDAVDVSSELSEVPKVQRRKLAKSLAWYEEHFSLRDDAIVNAYASGDYSMKVIADWFKVHYSTVSRVVKKHESKT
ncbi:MAG: transposase [Gammaproteobacteria bacterium]|nr:transposase [Gammaproteobacteria bacterium]